MGSKSLSLVTEAFLLTSCIFLKKYFWKTTFTERLEMAAVSIQQTSEFSEEFEHVRDVI